MAGRIPEAFISDLVARTDIVDIVQSRMELRRAGRDLTALCPFHDENSPSFTVSPTKQFYHCFGCGAHGNAIGFVMEYDGLSFVDAVEELARAAGVDVPREAGPARPDGIDEVYAKLQECQHWYVRQLKNSPAAIQYLRDRGIDGETAKRFAIGYAPDRWDGVMSELGQNAAAMKLLRRGGMISEGDGGRRYDKFRARIIFPIQDPRGRPIAFGGRTLEPEGKPKYLNSPETELFHKGKQLYGLHQARQSGGRLERILVVEGYMDVVALAQHGITEVVATLGTATTPEHVELLFRNAPEVVFCFDGDKAGQRAAWRAVESALPRLRDGRQGRFLFMPPGDDPDSLIRREGAERFRERLAGAVPLSDVFFGHFQAQVDMTSLDGRSRFVELAQPLIAQIPEGPFRLLMTQRMEQLARVREHSVSGGPKIVFRANSRGRREPVYDKTLVRAAISLLVQQPTLAARVSPQDRGEIANLRQRGADLFCELLESAHNQPHLTTGGLLALWRDRPEAKHLATLAGRSLLQDDDDLAAEFDDAVAALTRAYNDQRLRELEEIQRQGQLSDALKAEIRERLARRHAAPGQ